MRDPSLRHRHRSSIYELERAFFSLHSKSRCIKYKILYIFGCTPLIIKYYYAISLNYYYSCYCNWNYYLWLWLITAHPSSMALKRRTISRDILPFPFYSLDASLALTKPWGEMLIFAPICRWCSAKRLADYSYSSVCEGAIEKKDDTKFEESYIYDRSSMINNKHPVRTLW